MILQENQICSICSVPKCIQRQNNFVLRSADPNKMYLNRKAFGSVTHIGNILNRLQQRLLFSLTYDWTKPSTCISQVEIKRYHWKWTSTYIHGSSQKVGCITNQKLIFPVSKLLRFTLFKDEVPNPVNCCWRIGMAVVHFLPSNACGYWIKTSEKWWTLMISVCSRDSELLILEQMLRKTDERENKFRIVYQERENGLLFCLLIQRVT